MHTHAMQSSSATPDSIRDDLLADVERLLRSMERHQEALEMLTTIGRRLECLPLASDEYAAASNRLRNAQRYIASDECGAAGYELKLLANGLRPKVTRAANRTRQLRWNGEVLS